MSNSDQEIDVVYNAWEDAWRQIDVSRIKELWDQDFDGLVYQSEDNPEPLTTWKEISDYWDAAPTILESVEEWRSVQRETCIVGDVALVFTKIKMGLRIHGVSSPFEGNIRCSLIMHKTGGGWRLIHYHESRAVDLDALLAELN